MLKEKARNINFVFGFEEAYGYVIKDITRDKDGIQSAIVAAEAAWYYQKSQKTLVDVLENIYQKFGYYYCYTVNLILKGKTGQNTINNMLETLRTSKIPTLNNIKTIKVEDYQTGLHGMPSKIYENFTSVMIHDLLLDLVELSQKLNFILFVLIKPLMMHN